MGNRKRACAWIIACLVSALLVASTAQAERQRPPEESCADGYYTGPREGRKSYSNDKYLWVVSEDFAKRFCMPPEFIDKDLKGAEAVAFRMSTSTGGFDRCAIIDGKEECSGENELRFDIFLRSDLNLPAAHPEVKFYDGSRNDAGWHIAFTGKSPGERYSAGEYHLPLGAIPHFQNPFSHPDKGNYFTLIGIHKGKGEWPITGLKEWRYHANWTKDMDLVVLQEHPAFGFDNPRMEALGIHQFVIALNRRSDERKHWERRVPEDYAHVIWLPEKFFENVRAAATARGQSLREQLRTLR